MIDLCTPTECTHDVIEILNSSKQLVSYSNKLSTYRSLEKQKCINLYQLQHQIKTIVADGHHIK